ncbi:ABC transporter permease, partial [Lactobacillus sp. XV13L]|nr:ABC transporter permease [Lactobacillus sp. XV13L]
QSDSIIQNSQRVIRLQNLTTAVSRAQLVVGRYPRKINEIVLNQQDRTHYQLGQHLHLNSQNSRNLKIKSFKIVGFITSSDYLDKSQFGTTILKNGRVNTFGYISKSAFTKFQPTIAKLNFNNLHKQAYADSYERDNQINVDSLQPKLNRLANIKTKKVHHQSMKLYQQKQIQLHQLEQINSSPLLSHQLQQDKEQLKKLKHQLKMLPSVTYTLQTPNDYDYGYHTLGEEAQRIDILANVFPYVFFIVALIVCFTTMSRMASEKREELGVLTGLGYYKLEVVQVFLIYGTLSALVGATSGAYLGTNFLTSKIYQAYCANYALPNLITIPRWNWIAIASGIALAVAVLPALSVALQELILEPAKLLVPIVPAKGSKVIQEKIPQLWNHLSFKYKVTLR